MRSISMGDLVQTHLFRRQNTKLQGDITQLLGELSTGQSAKLGARLRGDYTALTGIERALAVQSSHALAIDEAGRLAAGQQFALSTVSSLLSGRGAAFAAAAAIGNPGQVTTLVSDAAANFQAIVGAINTRVGDRAVLAGAATQGQALADQNAMLAELQALTASDTTASGVMATLDAWFDTPGGGFETSGYLGSTTSLSSLALGETQVADIGLRADDPVLRETLKAFAVAALLNRGALSGSGAERLDLLDRAGRIMVGNEGAVTSLAADLGVTEARVDTARAHLAAEETSLKIFRDALIGIDEYDVASRLEEAQNQVEMLFAATARISRLSFVNFL